MEHLWIRSLAAHGQTRPRSPCPGFPSLLILCHLGFPSEARMPLPQGPGTAASGPGNPPHLGLLKSGKITPFHPTNLSCPEKQRPSHRGHGCRAEGQSCLAGCLEPRKGLQPGRMGQMQGWGQGEEAILALEAPVAQALPLAFLLPPRPLNSQKGSGLLAIPIPRLIFNTLW